VSKFFGKNNCCRDDWPGERAAPGFINPGDMRHADGSQFLFVAEPAAPIHLLGRLSNFRIGEIGKCDQ
jgi:hypothetical protein